MTIGELIAKEIKKAGFTQKEVASRIGISQTALSSICQGKAFPHVNNLNKICKLLEIEILFSVKRKVCDECYEYECICNQRLLG